MATPNAAPASANAVRAVVDAYSGNETTAVTANQVLTKFVVPMRCEIGQITADATAAGSGAGSSVLDVLLNGASLWATAANKPTLAAASTGAFALTRPDGGTNALRPGDVLVLKVLSVPATTGHAGVALSVGLRLRG